MGNRKKKHRNKQTSMEIKIENKNMNTLKITIKMNT